jgi:hypothetical protein
MTLQEYVAENVIRGECQCGKCCDTGSRPDPIGHTADLMMFKVAAKPEANAETLKKLAAEHHGDFGECNVFDGKEHSYIELGGWIGDQGLALMFMGLGHLLGLFDLLTPRTMLPKGAVPDEMMMQMAGAGYVTIKAKA